MRRTSIAAAVACIFAISAALHAAPAAEEKAKGVSPADFFVDPASVDLQRYLAPPPAQDSAQTQKEFAEIRHLQETRTPEREKIAQDDQVETVFAVVRDGLGPHFTAQDLPVTAVFFQQLLAVEGKVVDPAKDAWARKRPAVIDSTIKPCVKPSTSGSYPSGHTTVAYMTALVLSDLLPEHRAEIFESASRFAESRIICGVHYRSDIEASKTAAAVIIMQARTNPAFQKGFTQSKAEMRRVLETGKLAERAPDGH